MRKWSENADPAELPANPDGLLTAHAAGGLLRAAHARDAAAGGSEIEGSVAHADLPNSLLQGLSKVSTDHTPRSADRRPASPFGPDGESMPDGFGSPPVKGDAC